MYSNWHAWIFNVNRTGAQEIFLLWNFCSYERNFLLKVISCQMRPNHYARIFNEISCDSLLISWGQCPASPAKETAWRDAPSLGWNILAWLMVLDD